MTTRGVVKRWGSVAPLASTVRALAPLVRGLIWPHRPQDVPNEALGVPVGTPQPSLLTWGILEADSTQPGCFDQWDVSFLSVVANIMGVCLALEQAKRKHIEATAEAVRQEAQFDMQLRELQHRIKNNLQIVVAFLSRRTRELPQEVRKALSAATMRIQAIALAHDLLSVGEDASGVAFDVYLRSLCANLDPQRSNVTVEVEAEGAVIPIDRAVPAGLVVNELVTNSFKYAFGSTGGRIKVHFATGSRDPM